MGKFKTVARTVAAWIAVVLSLYVVFVIFNIWFLVPNDSIVSGPSPQLIRLKTEVTGVSVVAMVALIFFAKWAFKKPWCISRSGDGTSRREEWRKVLHGELIRWSSMSCNDVLAELRTRDVYEVVAESKQYQVEVVLLEDTPEYLHVSIAVDDGSLPASIHPESQSFLCRKVQELSR